MAVATRPPHPLTPTERLVYDEMEPMPQYRFDQLDWVWLNPIEVGDEGYPAGFPSTTNEELRRQGKGRWVLTQGLYVGQWIERNCVLANGRWIGKPFTLQQWQKRLLVELFEIDMETGLRRYRWSLIGLPKKNGKSEIAAALGLFMLHGDGEPSPNIVVAASSEEQANLVFGAANTMVRQSEFLKEVMVPGTKKITVPSSPNAFMEKVAAAAGTNDGKNIHGLIIDELHEWQAGKGQDCWNILTNGLGARLEPLIIQITTAGSNQETVCYTQYEHGCAIRSGDKVDETMYFIWWEYVETKDPHHWKTEEAVRSCNPSYGVTVHWKFFSDQLLKKTESVYRRYFLNQWTESEEIWEAASLWPDLAGTPREDTDLPLFVHIDIGLKHDSAAVVWGQWLQDEEGNWALHVHQKIWLNPHKPGTAAYKLYRLNVLEVENFLRELYDRFPESAREDEDEYALPGPAFFYDPHFFERSAAVLRDDGLNMIDYPQTAERMTAASQRIFEIIKVGELVHDGNEEAQRQIRSVVAKETERGWRIWKPPGSSKRVDFPQALAVVGREATRPVEDDGPFNIW